MEPQTWSNLLTDRVEPARAEDIRTFERQLAARRDGRLDEQVFAELRLRQGVYGQRYDNGKRHDGTHARPIAFPCGDLMKGPGTVWDAPGMVRVKLPYGGLHAAGLEALAELAEEVSDGILHVTTRQDVQLHFVHIEDTPDLMWRLAAAGITTKEACGNSVRNVTACPLAGVCGDEGFDVTPYAQAVADYFLGHPDTQDFGRKFKISFSGCEDHPCGLARIHDVGAVARVRHAVGADGQPRAERGFALYVGGGLGAVPHQAKLLSDWIPEAELLPTCQAICRVFAALGEKKNRARARLKFLLKKLGLDEFRRLVEQERARLAPDPKWTDFLRGLAPADGPSRPAGPLLRVAPSPDPSCRAWFASNVRPQAQPGYSIVTVALPLGDLTSAQARALAAIAREFTGDTIRATVEQNLVLRWVSNHDLAEVHARLAAVGLAEAGAGTLVDVTACPGTDTCKLGISSSRGLAAELRQVLAAAAVTHETQVRDLRIKVSGCFNSCGQHHVADLGFLGVARTVEGRKVPHFQVVLGGTWRGNGAAYGLAVGAVPSKRVPAVVDRLLDTYLGERGPDESFQGFVQRLGRRNLRELLSDLVEVPAFELAPDLYHDWADPRVYGIADMGQGECAGEMVSVARFGLSEAERALDDAHDALAAGDARGASARAVGAMVQAVRALVRAQTFDVPKGRDELLAQFERRFVATKLFWDEHARDKFVRYLHGWTRRDLTAASLDEARDAIQEASLFIDHAYRVEAKIGTFSASLQDVQVAQ